MSKEDLFSKLNIKDYNNLLENILEKKSFTENTKNILLSILYKMETAYDDYKKVKVFTRSKKELLEETIEIIQNNCEQIEIVKPEIDKETKLGDKKYIIEENKIISYPNDKNIFYALNHLNVDKFIINTNYTILKEPMEKLLNQGYIMDKNEIIRDFDGWTWSIVPEEIENHVYNIVYQNIKILLGNDFLKKFINHITINDFIQEFEKEIDGICTDENIDMAKLIYQIAILENMLENTAKKEDILKTKETLKHELEEMENKKEYLQKISNQKKIIGKEIREIDEIISNNKLLREKFIKDNENLEKEKRIFSLSEYTEMLQNKRNNLLDKLEEYSQLMKPMNFVTKKAELSKNNAILEIIEPNINIEEKVNTILMELQTSFLKLLNEKIKNIQSKKEIVEYIYLFRYYKLIYINRQEQIKDINQLSEEIRKVEKHLITRACKLKAVNILCNDIEKNYELVSKILSYNIIDLEDLSLEFKKHDKNIVLSIYDDDTIEDSIIYDGNEELNVKFNKKIKLFY